LAELLIIARTFSPNSTEIRDNQRTVVQHIKNRWNALNIQGGRKEADKFEQWNEKLDAVINGEFLEGFLKNLFVKHPDLFGRASSHLLDQYPHLERKSDFLKKYPELTNKLQAKKSEPQKAQEVPSGSKVLPETNKENKMYRIALPTDLSNLAAVRTALKGSKNNLALANFAYGNKNNNKIINKDIAQVIAEEMKINPKLSLCVTRQDEIDEIKSALAKIFSGSKASVGLETEEGIMLSENGSRSNIFILSIQNLKK
jgi:hypothetical protein